MLRLIIASIAVTGAFALAPTAAAGMCDNHGTGPGQIYKTACAKGGGGGGSTIMMKDPNTGVMKKVNHQDAILRPHHTFDN